jgi:hypothetical protein
MLTCMLACASFASSSWQAETHVRYDVMATFVRLCMFSGTHYTPAIESIMYYG